MISVPSLVTLDIQRKTPQAPVIVIVQPTSIKFTNGTPSRGVGQHCYESQLTPSSWWRALCGHQSLRCDRSRFLRPGRQQSLELAWSGQLCDSIVRLISGGVGRRRQTCVDIRRGIELALQHGSTIAPIDPNNQDKSLTSPRKSDQLKTNINNHGPVSYTHLTLPTKRIV